MYKHDTLQTIYQTFCGRPGWRVVWRYSRQASNTYRAPAERQIREKLSLSQRSRRPRGQHLLMNITRTQAGVWATYGGSSAPSFIPARKGRKSIRHLRLYYPAESTERGVFWAGSCINSSGITRGGFFGRAFRGDGCPFSSSHRAGLVCGLGWAGLGGWLFISRTIT